MAQDRGHDVQLWLFTFGLALFEMSSMAQKLPPLILLNYRNGKSGIYQHSTSSSPWSICLSHILFLKHLQQRMPGKRYKIDSTIVTLPLCTPLSSRSLPPCPWQIALAFLIFLHSDRGASVRILLVAWAVRFEKVQDKTVEVSVCIIRNTSTGHWELCSGGTTGGSRHWSLLLSWRSTVRYKPKSDQVLGKGSYTCLM